MVGYCAKGVIYKAVTEYNWKGTSLVLRKRERRGQFSQIFDDGNNPSLCYCVLHGLVGTIVRYWLFTIMITLVSHILVQLYYLYSLNCNRNISYLILAYWRLFSPGWKGEVVLTQVKVVLTQFKVVQIILKFNVVLVH